MATKALTYVAPRVSRDRVAPTTPPEHGRDWRELLIKEDGEAIWQKISRLIRTKQAKRRVISDEAIQEVFLRLLITGRFNAYIDLRFSEEEINLAILECFRE
jgi:hypothetical protein